jgi:pimeloyl-ACP methyl ester carboxylesterase
VCNVLHIDDITLVGQDLGGLVALRFTLAHRERVRALALLNTSAQDEDGWRRFKLQALASLAGSIGPVAYLTGELAKSMFSPAFRDTQPQLVAAWRRQTGRMTPSVVRDVMHLLANRDNLLPRLRSLRVPTLVIGSSQDMLTPPAHAEALAAALPLEQPGVLLAELVVFLTTCGVLPPGAALQAAPAQAVARAGLAARAATPAPTSAAETTPKASAKAAPWKIEAGWP